MLNVAQVLGVSLRNLQNIPEVYESQLTVRRYQPKMRLVDLEPFLLQ